MRFAWIMAALLVASCAPQEAKKPTPSPKEEVEKVSDAEFQAWLGGVKKEAREQGISQKTIDDAFAAVSHDPRVIQLDRKQPETKLTLEEYLAKTVTEPRISQGRELLAENRSLLDEISAKYGVPPQYIIALWAIETSYGNNTGGFSIIESLATLAYDGRRSEYFRGELMKALKIIDQGHIAAYDMEGSWAGAMGQCQFMPSSFLAYAVDYDGDGKRDIWNTQADVFASIANYLHSSGWNDDKDNNFNVLLKWNRSRYFATAVMDIAQGVNQ